jgi:hypothetical protein
MYEIECPNCNTEFEVKTWISGECPNCKRRYGWDEGWTEDDCFAVLDWTIYDE